MVVVVAMLADSLEFPWSAGKQLHAQKMTVLDCAQKPSSKLYLSGLATFFSLHKTNLDNIHRNTLNLVLWINGMNY